MANPNPQIYRDPEHWVRCKILSGTAEGVNRPKIVDWDSDSSNYRTGVLSHGVDNGYFEFAEPLDVTLCTTGQHPSVSCFSEIRRFQNPQTDAAAATPTEIIEHKTAPCNWTFGEVLALGGSLFGAIRDKSSSLQRWSPSTANDQGKNTNWNFSPFVTWGVRGALLQIRVMTITEYDEFSGVLIPHYNDNNIMSLDEWKNNHSSEPLQGIDFVFSGNTGEDENSITYATNWIYNDGTSVGACSIDQCGEYSGDPFYDYTRGFFNRANFFGLLPAGLNENYNDTADSVYFYGMDKLQGSEIRGVSNPSNGWRLGAVVPYSQANYEAILKMAACFAMAFTPTSKNTFTLTDNDYYLPIIREDGISYGEYTHGEENTENETGQISDIRSIDYDPYSPIPIDPNTYSDTTGFNSLSGGATATLKYVLNDGNVRQLLSDLWAISHTIAGADYEKYDYKIMDSFLVTNPIDSIVSLKRFPFSIPHTFSPNKTPVRLGKNQGTSEGYLTYNVFNNVVFKGINIYPKFGNSYLDCAPYTEYELYIPFCGTVKLNAGDILGHTLKCRMDIDLTTGACIAYIMADNLVLETASGVVSSDLQLSGTDSATVDSSIQNAVINHIGARTNKEVAMLSPLTFGGLLSAVSNPVKTAAGMETANNEISRADYNLTHIQTPVHSMGNTGGLTGWIQEFNARLMIYYPEGDAIDSSGGVSASSPKLADLTDYAHNVGFSCCMNGIVSEFHGKTVGNIDTSSIAGATEEERAQIKSLFAQGVWLP